MDMFSVNMKGKMLSKALAVTVIILFIGVGIQPSVAVTQKEAITVSTLNPDDTRYLANFTMDFGENITNDGIEYNRNESRPYGNWTVNVRMNFSCPDNLMITGTYSYIAELENIDLGDIFIFCDVIEGIHIENGSNPPDIDIDYYQNVIGGYKQNFIITLKFRASIRIHEYINGSWILIDEDDVYHEIEEIIYFNRIRPSERTKNPDNACKLCPSFNNKISFCSFLETFLNRYISRDVWISDILDLIENLQIVSYIIGNLYWINSIILYSILAIGASIECWEWPLYTIDI